MTITIFNDKMFIKELSAKIKKMLKTKKEKAKKALNDTVYNNTLAEISNIINDNITNITEFKGAIMSSHPKYYEISSHYYEISSHYNEFSSQILCDIIPNIM